MIMLRNKTDYAGLVCVKLKISLVWKAASIFFLLFLLFYLCILVFLFLSLVKSLLTYCFIDIYFILLILECKCKTKSTCFRDLFNWELMYKISYTNSILSLHACCHNLDQVGHNILKILNQCSLLLSSIDFLLQSLWKMQSRYTDTTRRWKRLQ